MQFKHFESVFNEFHTNNRYFEYASYLCTFKFVFQLLLIVQLDLILTLKELMMKLFEVKQENLYEFASAISEYNEQYFLRYIL